jgi:hypothetical protein
MVSGRTCQFEVVQRGLAWLTECAGTVVVDGSTNQNERVDGHVDEMVTTTLARQVVSEVWTSTGLVGEKAREAALLVALAAVVAVVVSGVAGAAAPAPRTNVSPPATRRKRASGRWRKRAHGGRASADRSRHLPIATTLHTGSPATTGLSTREHTRPAVEQSQRRPPAQLEYRPHLERRELERPPVG